MSCALGDRLTAYHDGELDALARADVERHIRDCPSCRAELAELSAMSGLFAQAERPGLSQIARRRLHDRADRVMQADFLWIARVMQAVAASVLVAGSLWLTYSSGRAGGTQSAQTVPTAPPWVDVAVAVTAQTRELDATTPAAAWYLADASSRSDEVP